MGRPSAIGHVVIAALALVALLSGAGGRVLPAGGHAGAARPAAGYVPPANPPANIPAEPRLVGALCSSTTIGGNTTYHCDNPCADPQAVLAGKPSALDSSAACTKAAVAAIDRARATEHVAALVLPRNWASLSVPEQLFVITDLERVARGVPPLVGLAPALDVAAAAGAATAKDPDFPLSPQQPGPETSNWAGGEYSPLIADYGWMYQDGWGAGNGNLDCASPHAAGCWGHRDAILGAVTGTKCADCVMGAGFAAGVKGWGTSYAEVILLPGPHADIRLTFTWKADVVPQLPAG